MYTFSTASGSWTNTNDSYDTSAWNNGSFGGSLVAGAVDLNNGKYMFGGFDTIPSRSWPGSMQVFKLWQYDPGATPKFTYLGYLNTNKDVGYTTNGDMAFDAQGNLFVVRGSGTNTTVFSVTAANLAQAGGGLIASSASNTFQTSENVNGVAFDASGKAYLGSSTTLQSYDMPNWSNQSTVTDSLKASTDLASCSSPATITVQKVVKGRVTPTDQFTMSLNDAQTQLGSATTSGTQNGLQSDQVGPQPTVRGKTLSFSETGAGGANLDNYATTYQCTVDGAAMSPAVAGSGTSGRVTIPSSGDAVVCQFTNSPLIARVNVTKTLLDQNGANPQPGSDWTMGMSATPSSGTVTQSPSGSQQTDSQGKASWTVNFGTADSAANVAVNETQKTGYRFASGQCVVTDNNGDKGSPVTMTSQEGVSDLAVLPGETVDCSFTNQKQQTSLTLVKVVHNAFGGTAGVNDFNLAATSGGGSSLGFTSGQKQDVAPGTYTLSEKDLAGTGYVRKGVTCSDEDGNLAVDGTAVDVADGKNVTCRITNDDEPGSVSWSKEDVQGLALSGSTWLLTGTGVPLNTVVTDCTSAGQCGSGPYDDQDPRPGHFKLSNQQWGSYALSERTAPAGYVLSDATHDYTISAADRDYAFPAAFVNKQQTPPTLPLTGGMSTDSFLLGGLGLIVVAIGAGVVLRKRLF
ncbi:MAG: SpaA isopeptide-forming pilin-related protein [Bifidobacterium mongoliense]|uniref:SpaA isopeptide-forming pilin-related protein n=1 Tax=Bifidobacterium mongoliense TaxID=518643 RepID=UPI002F357ABE